MDGNPILSVIIPAYNSEESIEKCVRSILVKPFKPLEIIAVDDGSTDGTYQVLSNLALEDERLKVFKKENGGVSSARNYGLSHMSDESEFFTFVDSDDLIENNIYEKAVSILNSNPEIGMAIFSHSSIGEDGETKNYILTEETVDGDYARNIIAYDNHPFGGGYVWNRVFRKVGYWSKSPVYFREDIDFGLREIVYSDGLSSDSRNKCILNYAGGFTSALNFAMENNNGEMIGILNELLGAEPPEIQKILAVAFKKLTPH